MNPTAYPGELAALTAASLWAFATLLFSRLGKHLTPLTLNLAKGAIAIAFLLLTLLLRQQLFTSLPLAPTFILLASGAIGIGIGDTAYFAAVNTLGPRRALLMETLAPPLSALLAFFFLNERLSPISWLGIAVTLAGIAWVIAERAPRSRTFNPPPEHLQRGIALAFLAASAQATGAFLSRTALASTTISPDTIDPLWSTLLRLSAGVVSLLAILAARPHLARNASSLRSPSLLGSVAIAALFGTYLAIWLQQIALKFAPTGIAQSLLATSPVFVLPMALAIGDRVTLRATLGALVAVTGVCLLFVG